MAAKRTRKTKTTEPGWLVGLGGMLGSGFAFSIRALPLLLILGGVAYGSVTLWRESLADPRYKIQPYLRLGEGSRNCPEAVAAFRELAVSAGGRSLLDPYLLRDLRAEYEGCVWVRKVCRMERSFPNEVNIEFIARNPVAQVWHMGYYWLVDEDGRMLPVQGLRHPRGDLPVIAGVVRNRPRDGSSWSDPGVMGALGVLQAIQTSALCEDLPVAKVHVRRTSYLDRLQTPRETRPRMVIETAQGVRILWGTFNEGDIPEEMLTGEKIAMLRKILARGIPLQPGLSLDIRTREAGYVPPQASLR